MEIKTKLGVIKARLIDSKEYPGISVGILVDGEWIEYVWLEVDQSGDNAEPVLKIHAFNSVDDEPVFDLDQTEADIRKFFE